MGALHQSECGCVMGLLDQQITFTSLPLLDEAVVTVPAQNVSAFNIVH